MCLKRRIISIKDKVWIYFSICGLINTKRNKKGGFEITVCSHFFSAGFICVSGKTSPAQI